MGQFVRYLWPLPFSLLAALALILVVPLSVSFARRDGALQAYGPGAALLLRIVVPWMAASGLTIGHVLIYRNQADARTLHAHEIVHVRQWERWGLLFPLAYGVASVRAAMAGGHYYRDNVFEVEARQIAGF
jgi:hypothetical protein